MPVLTIQSYPSSMRVPFFIIESTAIIRWKLIDTIETDTSNDKFEYYIIKKKIAINRVFTMTACVNRVESSRRELFFQSSVKYI